MDRREALRSIGLLAGVAASGGALAWANHAAKRCVVHVVVFSNFEGSLNDAPPAIEWFNAATAAHPSIVWTHMYNPAYLATESPEMRKAEAIFSPYLLDLQASGQAEVGLHLHCYYDTIERLGVKPRGYPYAGDATPGCDDAREPAADRGRGYDVLLTGYTAAEQTKLLEASTRAFVDRGFERPTSFCAGYSAADPSLQAVLAESGFRVSFAAQTIPPAHYGTCWERLIAWSGKITPLTIPYRVARDSILPPPHAGDEYLDLVEVPLNLGVDANDLFLSEARVDRQDIFDRHFAAASRAGRETAVCIGVHAEVVAEETWGRGPVSAVIDSFLTHVARRAGEGGAEIRYGKVSVVAARFRENISRNSVAE